MSGRKQMEWSRSAVEARARRLLGDDNLAKAMSAFEQVMKFDQPRARQLANDLALLRRTEVEIVRLLHPVQLAAYWLGRSREGLYPSTRPSVKAALARLIPLAVGLEDDLDRMKGLYRKALAEYRALTGHMDHRGPSQRRPLRGAVARRCRVISPGRRWMAAELAYVAILARMDAMPREKLKNGEMLSAGDVFREENKRRWRSMAS